MPRYRANCTVYAGGRAHPPGSTVELSEDNAAVLPAESISRIADPEPAETVSGSKAASGNKGKAGRTPKAEG
jgi:hypothetical protein